MEIEINFEKTCRTCAEYFDDELHPIFVAKNSNIVKMLEGLGGFNFKITQDDDLPKGVCDNCSKQLTQIYMFLLQCEKSEIVLTNLQKKIKNIKIEDLRRNYENKIEITDDDYEDYKFSDRDNSFCNLLQDITSNEKSRATLKKECSQSSSNSEEEICKENSELNDEELYNAKFHKKVHNLRKRKRKISKKNRESITENSEESFDEDDKNLNTNDKLPKKKYECTICSSKFEKFANLRQHKKKQHPTQPITYLCDVCGKEFNKRDRLLQHKNRHSGFKPFKCDICEKCFSIKGSLRSHIQRHVNPEKFTCATCGKSFLIKKCYEEHLRRHGEKLFKCPYCPRTFKLLSTLTHHCTFHNKTLDKKYHCSECNTNFRRSDHLKEHINGVHLKILPFKCEECPQAFVTGAKRNIHVKRMHSGRRYQCNQCEKDFSLPSSLNRHKKGHSGVKSLICEICNESFVTPNQIKKHMETHQLDEAAKNNLITQTYEKIKQIAINQDEINESKISNIF